MYNHKKFNYKELHNNQFFVRKKWEQYPKGWLNQTKTEKERFAIKLEILKLSK